QLRATVSESGIQGEPTRQMLDYIWGGNILLPSDIKTSRNSLVPSNTLGLGLGLATSIDYTLIDTKPQRIPTGIKGPIAVGGQAVGALLIGRASATMVELNIAVGLTDADYTGEIYIMVQTLYPPLHIPAGTRIAHLIPLPCLAQGPAITGSQCGKGGFGSTGQIILVTVDLKQRPRKQVVLQFRDQSITLTALLDTGADVMVVSAQEWPPHWPTVVSADTVAGVGGLTLAKRS
ncbi:POK9 protein, partial [Oreotrochilus melanogaster]|nr:POK9 protein [Oreotrochilus melanogaster]